jgi:hypothetical protein
LLGASVLLAVKLSTLLAILVGSVTMYTLARSFFGTAGGVVAAALYTWAPYKAVDIFVRGALAESWGLALLPLVFLTGERALRAERRRGTWALATAFAWCALLLTHNLVSMMAAPVYLAWCLLWLLSAPRCGWTASSGRVVSFALAHLLAVALAAHYLIPSLFELHYTHSSTLISPYLQPSARYENNFVDLPELLLGTTPWGFGLFRGPGRMSLFAGGLHWGLALASGPMIAAVAIRRRQLDRPSRAALLLGLSGAWALFMILDSSKAIWDTVPGMPFVQFPWRFLGIASFGLSFAGASLIGCAPVRGWLESVLATVLVALVVASGWSWFRPAAMYLVRDEVLANEREVASTRHGLFDFMPQSVDLERFPTSPPKRPPPAAEILEGRALVREPRKTSRRVTFGVEVQGTDPATVRINTYRFPGWTLRVDGKKVSGVSIDDPLGRLHLRVPTGLHRVSASFENTPVRSISEGLSLLGVIAAMAWATLLWRRERGC